MKPEGISVESKIGDEVFRFETGRVAGQANGAVLASAGDTTVLATATSWLHAARICVTSAGRATVTGTVSLGYIRFKVD